jgi:hypothetical protein
MRRALAALALTGLLAGCGSTSSEYTVDPAVRSNLLGDVSSISAAAQRSDRAESESALARLTRNVAAAQAQGRLDGQTARSILAAADRVSEDVRTFRPPPPVVITVPQPQIDDSPQTGDNDGKPSRPGKHEGKPGKDSNGDRDD